METRAYHSAWSKVGAIAHNWRKYVKKQSRLEAQKRAQSLASKEAHILSGDAESTHVEPDNNAADNVDEDNEMKYWPDSDGDDDYNQHTSILIEGYQSYVAKHVEELRIIQNQSFARTVATALSGCTTPISFWFNDGKALWNRREMGALKLAHDMDLIRSCISAPKGWGKIESLQGSDAEEDLLMPARLLADIPIACHEAGVRIKTLHVCCFPLVYGFQSLVPSHARGKENKEQANPWTRLATACRELIDFDFNASNCMPVRHQRLPEKDYTIMIGYISAACSSAQLQFCKLSFRVYGINDGKSTWWSGDRTQAPRTETYYLGAPILNSLVSKDLRSLTIMYVEVDGATLLNALAGLHASQLQFLYLCSIVLTQGRWLDITNQLHDLLCSRPDNGKKPRISMSSLRGMEFGAAVAFEERDPWFSGDAEEWDRFFEKLETHQHPALQKDVEEWITKDRGQEPNPLALMWETQVERGG